MGQRFPDLRPLLLVGRLASSPEALRETVSDPATRLDALLALAEPQARAHAAIRNQLLVEALGDADLPVVRAALKGVRTWKLPGAGPRVLELAKAGEPDALETLATLTAEDPTLGFDLIVENARRSPPVLVGLEGLATASKLSLAQVDVLEGLLPTLPAGPAADAIRRRLERKKPKTGTRDEQLDALEAAIDERPDDVDAWLVWSDAVQGSGDPRGELVALAHAGKPVEAKLKAALPSLAPTLANVLRKPDALLESVRLHMGLPREVRFAFLDEPGSQDELIAAVLGAPLGRFVTSVRLGLTSEVGDENDWEPSLEALHRYGRGVRALLLGDFVYPDECEMSWVDWGDVSGAWTLPRLERLHLRGGHGTIGVMSSPTLKELVIETGGLSQTVINQLLSGSLPALTSLTLWTGDPDYGGDSSLRDIEGVLGWAPRGLTRLGIENCAFTHELVPLFARHPLTKRLSRLSFAQGVLRPEDADALISDAGAFAHLEQLDLTGNLLDEGTAERIVAALPRAVVTDQREDYGDEGARYVAVGE
ncbi:MAG: TIGR02996 domain-containing protein [Myxococcaceae bacterium]|nr:TIGR02996 domain-containing protein [Myxococcaceae bacterium]